MLTITPTQSQQASVFVGTMLETGAKSLNNLIAKEVVKRANEKI